MWVRSIRAGSCSASAKWWRPGEAEGAQLYQPPGCRLPEKGFWFAPSIFTGVTPSHRVAREEIFGPVLSVLTFRTMEEAIEKANNTAYGLIGGRVDG